MRTRIYLRRRPDGEYDVSPDAPYADVNHSEPLTAEAVEAYRKIGLLAIETPRPCPQREPMSQR